MDAIEALAIVILILAILVLVYYYIQNSPSAIQKIRSYVPAGVNSYSDQVNQTNVKYEEDSLEREKDKKDSMSKKIKVKLSDIDMSSFNTDAFSKKIDAFLDEKSDQLIQDWALATTDDLSALEEKVAKTTKSVDDLENQFKKFKMDSDKKFNEFDKRIKALEED